MITLPISDLLLLPGVTFFFKKDVFPSGEITAESVGEDILFIMEKEEKEQMTPDNFYPIGVIGTIDSVDEEGNVRVKVRETGTDSDTEMGKDGDDYCRCFDSSGCRRFFRKKKRKHCLKR